MSVFEQRMSVESTTMNPTEQHQQTTDIDANRIYIIDPFDDDIDFTLLSEINSIDKSLVIGKVQKFTVVLVTFLFTIQRKSLYEI